MMQPDTPVISYISYVNDKDYYKFAVTAPVTIYLSLTNLPADYDLYLFDSWRNPIGYSAYGGMTAEYITNTVTISGVYYALVQGAGPVYDTANPYGLAVSLEPASATATATPTPTGTPTATLVWREMSSIALYRWQYAAGSTE